MTEYQGSNAVYNALTEHLRKADSTTQTTLEIITTTAMRDEDGIKAIIKGVTPKSVTANSAVLDSGTKSKH